MADEELPDRSGTLLADRYRLVQRLGAGGMGEVYKAVNEVVNREVAIKLLKPEYAKIPDVVQRVLREARSANEVKHPNVVDVLDVATDAQGAPIIVQELLQGEDLAHFLAKRGTALSEQEVLDLMIPVCEAVGAAHRAGIMHRDLKLENVFLHHLPNGTVVPKVLDFGLSRHVGEDAVSRLTATGVAMGTPMYMSPEQVQGERDIDQRTDVWALGIMLYELTAGRLPFTGESLGAIFVKICTVDPEPLRPLAPQVSDAYVAIVERCLRRERSARYPSAVELAADLVRLQQGTLDATIAHHVDSATPPNGAASLSPGSEAASIARTLVATPAHMPLPSPVAPSVGLRASSRSIGPTVSQVPPPPKRVGIVATASLVTIALVGAGAWWASRWGVEEKPHAHSRPAAARPSSIAPASTTVESPAAPVFRSSTPTPELPAPAVPTPLPASTETVGVSTAGGPSASTAAVGTFESSRSGRGAHARRRRRDATAPPSSSARPRVEPEPTYDRPHRRPHLLGGGTTRFE